MPRVSSVGGRDGRLAGANGRPSGVHSLPSKRVSTGPRKYISAGAGAAPSKRIRIAIDSSRATSVIEPIFMVFDRPGLRDAVLRHAPERADAREQQEQQRHHRRAEQRGARGQAAGLAQARLADRHVGEDERR